jgi:hypothetical protein
MKIFLPILFVAVCFFGCKKNNVTPPSITGLWELRNVISGNANADSTYSSGNGNGYQFNSNNTYSRYRGDTVIAKGTFVIKTNATTVNHVVYNSIIFDGNNATSQVIQVADGNTLTLGLTANGGTAYLYAKVQ